MKMIIPGTLPSMNQIIDAAKSHYGIYSSMKRTYTNLVSVSAKKSKLPVMERIDVRVTWYCDTMRQDKDNISAGVKFILDGLQAAGVIKNDGWKQIGRIEHDFAIDRENPRVEVDVIEVSA